MNENYEFKQTGSMKIDRATTMGHILAHIENGRNFFGIESKHWGGPWGFEYSDVFPSSVNRLAREIDIQYSVRQDRSYQYTPTHEVDYATDEDWSSEWPRINRTHSILTGEKTEEYADHDDQVSSWISTLNYMLHDANVSYIYAIGSDKDSMRRNQPVMDDDELRSIACAISNWKSSFREERQREYNRTLVDAIRAAGLDVEYVDGLPTIIEMEMQNE